MKFSIFAQNKFYMKKVLAIAFVGSLVALSCSKKADNSLQDSNVMMEEPKTEMAADSTAKTDNPALDQGNESARMDSTSAKKQTIQTETKPADTVKAKK